MGQSREDVTFKEVKDSTENKNGGVNEEIELNKKTLKDLISKLTDATHDQNRIINTLQDANKQIGTENEKQRKKYADLQEQLELSKALEAASLSKSHKHQTDTQRQLSETEYRLKVAERTIQQMKKEKEDYERKINQLEINLLNFGKLELRIDELKKENLVLKDRAENICREKVILQRKTDTVEQERDTLKQRIDSWIAKNHSTVNVQVYAAVNRELCGNMMNEFEEMLITQFGLKNTLINVEKHKEPPPNSTVPLIVICSFASRIGTDVKQAIHDIDRSRTIALVILHNNEYHALPKEPSERILTGSDYKHIGAIVDIAYLKHKGIYPCDMNESSLDKLVNFISTNS